ncbi:MAG: 23S rRNA pseudouridine(955/2504/2580) synthase [Candidatus Westeberhardia cardiocondylae]|nr:23S rRNA pseudouridine(955/2504/2580) synthase [Candidatus Westeberhardia cardiocondylae]
MDIKRVKVHFIVISSHQFNQRVDNFLINYLKGIPKSKIYHIIRNGEVRINKKRIKCQYKLKINDILRIPPLHMYKMVQKKPIKCIALHKYIIYEDDSLMIINKPTGIAVHGGYNWQYGGIIEMLKMYYKNIHFLELVHRLDKDTSGILLIAKKNSMLRALHELLRNRKIKKNYLALVSGVWSSKITEIAVPLYKFFSIKKKCIMQVNKKYGKLSKTIFKVQERFAKIATLMQAIPITGRTHQIRIHTQYAGHPIACDDRYGDKNFDLQMKYFGVNRLFLHAFSISFKYPNTEKILSIQAPLDKTLLQCLQKLRVVCSTYKV